MALTFVMNSLTRGIYMLKWLAKKSAKILTVKSALEGLMRKQCTELSTFWKSISILSLTFWKGVGGWKSAIY